MDWSKAKNIILIGLILTNLFLILQYFKHYNNMVQSSDAVNDYTISILKENNIEVACEIPDKIEKMYPITVSYSDLGDKDKDILLKKAKSMDEDKKDEEIYKKASDTFLKDNGFMSKGTKLQEIRAIDDSIILEYENYYGNIPLEESYMSLKYNSGKLVDMKRHWIVPTEQGESRIEVLSPLSALLRFMSEIDDNENKTVVKNIRLVYYVMPYKSEKGVLYDTAFPAWAITYNESKVKYISTIE